MSKVVGTLILMLGISLPVTAMGNGTGAMLFQQGCVAYDLVPPPSADPTKFSGTGFVAWEFEGTRIRGTNRTDYFGDIDEAFNFTAYFRGVTFRGRPYSSGGISGSGFGNLISGDAQYEAVRMVVCTEYLPMSRYHRGD